MQKLDVLRGHMNQKPLMIIKGMPELTAGASIHRPDVGLSETGGTK